LIVMNETANKLGIRIGKVVEKIEWRSSIPFLAGWRGVGRIIETVNRITLSAGDDRWDSAARNFAEAAQ
jgi:hypothetical protein